MWALTHTAYVNAVTAHHLSMDIWHSGLAQALLLCFVCGRGKQAQVQYAVRMVHHNHSNHNVECILQEEILMTISVSGLNQTLVLCFACRRGRQAQIQFADRINNDYHINEIVPC